MNIGIIGAGHIARKMASALASEPQGCRCYAVASRSQQKADDFAAEFGIERAYGSYEALLSDPAVDLVYIATPHSHHFSPAMMAIAHRKPCLVEKSFAANAAQAKAMIAEAERQGVFITEAIWTRYLPMSHKIKELLDGGAIGEPKALTASLCYKIDHKERVLRPELCGGALLDVGVYTINFARMYFGTDIVRTASNCLVGPTGVDMHENVSLTFGDGRMASLQSGALCFNDRQGIISGTEGYLRVDNVNCPTTVEVYRGMELAETYHTPTDMINGFEYQVFECKRCIEAGLLESPMMPHAETVAIMQQMDALRRDWGVRYPMD